MAERVLVLLARQKEYLKYKKQFVLNFKPKRLIIKCLKLKLTVVHVILSNQSKIPCICLDITIDKLYLDDISIDTARHFLAFVITTTTTAITTNWR